MPQGVIGHGMPSGQTNNYTPSNSQVRFGATNFREITDDIYTLGEALNKAQWDKLLPSENDFDKRLKAHLFNNSFWLSTTQNIINGLSSLLFFAAVVGLSARFFRFATNSDLSANEDNFETGRVGTDVLGYFLAPFIITLSAAIITQITIILGRIAARLDYTLIIDEFKRLHQAFIKTHNITTVFFSLTEIIHYLENAPLDLNTIEEKLIETLGKVNLSYSSCLNPDCTSIKQMSPADIIEKLKQLLLGSEFSFLMGRIQMHIKQDPLITQDKTILYDTREKYETKVDIDPFTRRVILSMIGRISSKKQAPVSSTLINPLPLIDWSTHSTISSILNNYWNEPNTTFIHPYDVDLAFLASYVNHLMNESFPGFLIPEIAQAQMTINALPSGGLVQQLVPTIYSSRLGVEVVVPEYEHEMTSDMYSLPSGRV